jgi:hypothetical protein
MKKINLPYIARSLIIIYILFITLFSLDTEFAIGFFIHLLPSAIFLLTLILTWKKPKLAGVFFVLEGIGTIFVFNTYRDLFVLFAVSLTPIFVGILFWILGRKK